MDISELPVRHKRKDFVLLGCGTYFIEDNTIQYSTAVILYYNSLHPMFLPDLVITQEVYLCCFMYFGITI